MDINNKNMNEMLINGLEKVKEQYINQNNALKFSIRKDEVAYKLKEILRDNNSEVLLKESMNLYINELLQK